MIFYLELILERLTGMKNRELLAKIMHDLAQDTLKFKINEVTDDLQAYVSRINTIMNQARAAC
jgi:DnaJ-domain-containing protein 1